MAAKPVGGENEIFNSNYFHIISPILTLILALIFPNPDINSNRNWPHVITVE